MGTASGRRLKQMDESHAQGGRGSRFVLDGTLSAADARGRYMLSEEDFASWLAAYDRHGVLLACWPNGVCTGAGPQRLAGGRMGLADRMRMQEREKVLL